MPQPRNAASCGQGTAQAAGEGVTALQEGVRLKAGAGLLPTRLDVPARRHRAERQCPGDRALSSRLRARRAEGLRRGVISLKEDPRDLSETGLEHRFDHAPDQLTADFLSAM